MPTVLSGIASGRNNGRHEGDLEWRRHQRGSQRIRRGILEFVYEVFRLRDAGESGPRVKLDVAKRAWPREWAKGPECDNATLKLAFVTIPTGCRNDEQIGTGMASLDEERVHRPDDGIAIASQGHFIEPVEYQQSGGNLNQLKKSSWMNSAAPRIAFRR